MASKLRAITTMAVAASAMAWSLCSCAKDSKGSDDNRPPVPPGTLIPVSVTRLHDSDTSYVGAPVSFAVSVRNEYFIVDRFSVRVLRYDSSGRFAGGFGRQGQGPNEFMQPNFIEFADDTTALISDPVRRDFTLWNIGKPLVRARVPYQGGLGFFSAGRGTITGTVFNRVSGTIAARWHLPATQPQYLGKLPAVFAPSNRFANIYGFIPLAEFGDSVAYFTGESDYLRIADSAWNVSDSIHIPRRIRRGAPKVIDTTMGKGRTIYDVMSQLSNPYALHQLSGARFAVLHVDFSIRNNVPMGSVFLTVVSKRGVPRCIDIPLPVHDANTIARVAFRGDTLFVLDQYVLGEHAVIDIERFALDVGVC